MPDTINTPQLPTTLLHDVARSCISARHTCRADEQAISFSVCLAWGAVLNDYDAGARPLLRDCCKGPVKTTNRGQTMKSQQSRGTSAPMTPRRERTPMHTCTARLMRQGNPGRNTNAEVAGVCMHPNQSTQANGYNPTESRSSEPPLCDLELDMLRYNNTESP